MLLGLSDTLPRLVEAKYKAAKGAQSLIFSPTELAILRTPNGLPFQLRYCPSLAKKPQPLAQKAPKTKKPNPFENPDPALHIADIPSSNPTHYLVLNKFPIIPEHFILVTKSYKQQTHALEEDDLEATYVCLKAWQGDLANGQQRRLFAFFNSGEHSGASQPHRHLQFLPVENVKADNENNDWELLIDDILANAKPADQEGLLQNAVVPFTHYAVRFPDEPTPSQLLKAYHDLYRAAEKAVRAFEQNDPAKLALHSTEGGDLPISYNLGITTSGMVILPRRAEGGMLRRDDGTEAGFVALNGTTIGGTLMVKHEEEWKTLRAQPSKLDGILNAIGIPNTSYTQKL
ncbi:HIT-like protein [Aaosphaeria arxii CBS 175.79]|uniref:HIT-like protein n=1 Tax=Aaosphaeria arxii CBS 175.79 TaxID=1450172 RepID=A0A6A5Y9C5_9PLEO|nr:HIT-like protein [Aaosphaeria arxii CBS 175.79]KAF2022202.1 HIT-like protein [Aaosphaeria arxii CBS 175.79]